MLSTHLCVSFEGHLEALFHVFAYLGIHHNARVVFDPTYPSVEMGTFISKVMVKLLIGDLSNGDYTRAKYSVGLIYPCCHPQSKVGKFASTKQYYTVSINGR
jgi:hypothetical protein